MGMSESEFWACTPRYFAARQKAFIETRRRDMERARFTGWLASAPPVIKGGKMSVTDAFRFDWEEMPTPKQMDPAEREALLKFQEDAKKIFEKQFGVKFEQAPAEPAMNGKR